jgi:hypothetical protein
MAGKLHAHRLGHRVILSTPKETIDALKGTPILLAAMILNVIVLAGFGWTIHQVSSSIERRDALIKSCLEK